jgi:hypothetical protein
MVLGQRIAALQQRILEGNQVSITYSYSTVSGKLKTKVMVSAMAGVVPPSARSLLMASLQPILDSMWHSVIVDRGHTYSDGHACACFWIEPCIVDSPDSEISAEVDEVLEYLTEPSDRSGSKKSSPNLNPEAAVFVPKSNDGKPKRPTEPRPLTARPARHNRRKQPSSSPVKMVSFSEKIEAIPVNVVTLSATTTHDEDAAHQRDVDELASSVVQMFVDAATPLIDSVCDILEQHPAGLPERSFCEEAITRSVLDTLQPLRKKLLEDKTCPEKAALVKATWGTLRLVLAPLVHTKTGERWFGT